MASFDSGGFDSGSFDTGAVSSVDVTTTRDVVEALAGFAETGVRRAVVEAIYVPSLLHSALYRYAVEAITVPPPVLAGVVRAVVEVVSPMAFLPGVASTETLRSAVEVLGLASATSGRALSSTRFAVEVLASAGIERKHLLLPGPTVSAVHVLAAVTLDLASGPGYLGVQATNGDGFSVSWEVASPLMLNLAWKTGNTVQTSSVNALTQPQLLQLGATGAGGAVALANIGQLAPPDHAATGTLHELMVFDAVQTGATLAQYTNYLTGKWVDGQSGLSPAMGAHRQTLEPCTPSWQAPS